MLNTSAPSSPDVSETDSDTSVEELSPPREVNLSDLDRQSRINEFVCVTEGSAEDAKVYLGARNWDVVKAVNGYFKFCRREEKRKRRISRNYSSDDADDEQDTTTSPTIKKTKKKEKFIKKDLGESSHRLLSESKEDQVEYFRLISWNINGIHEKNLSIRTNAICDIILKEKAYMVFLQEVTNAAESIINERLSGQFNFYSAHDGSETYHVLTLVAKLPYVQVLSNEILHYPETSMGRNLLKTTLTVYDNSICLLNTHLESTKEFSNSRVKQLAILFEQCKTIDRKFTVLAGGDLNLRDKELQSMGGLPCEIEDTWISTGRRKEVEYTWDMMRNDNPQFYDSSSKNEFKPRLRFDRVFIRKSIPTRIDIVHFGLTGLERLKPNVCFPSDHWGVITSFKIFHC